MKRILSLVLCAILLVTAVPFSVTAEGAPQLVVGSAETTTEGGEVALTVRALNAASLTSARFWLKVSAPMEITGATAAATLPEYTEVGPTEGEYAEANGVSFVWVSGTQSLASDDAELVTYTVKVPAGMAAGEYDVSLVVSAEDMIDIDKNEVAFETVSGKITVIDKSAPQLVVGSAETTTDGGEVALTVRALNAASLTSARFWLKVSAPMEITGATASAALPEYTEVGPTEGEYAETNGVSFVWVSGTQSLASDDAELVTYTVKVPAGTPEGEYDVSLVVSAEDMIDIDKNEVAFKTVSGKVTVTAKSGPQLVVGSAETTTDGGEVALTVRALNAASLTSARFWLKVSAPMEITGATAAAALPEYTEVGPTEGEYAEANGVSFVWVSGTQSLASDDAELVTYTVKVPAGTPEGEYDVSLVISAEDMIDIDKNEVAFEAVPGKITVTAAAEDTYTLTAWSWSDDNSAAQATFVSDTDPDDVRTVDAEVSVTRTEPTCDTDGSVVTTAKVTFNGKEYTDTKTEILEATGHAYSVVWTWDDAGNATATFTCANDPSETATVAAEVSEERTEPTCDTDGSVVYTAKVTFDGKEYTDTKTEILEATGHAYSVVWTWDDAGNATATFTCENHAVTVTVPAEVSTERTEPTCDTDGSVVTTAKVIFEGKEYTDTKTEILEATGHAYSVVWTWDDAGNATATFTCANDPSDTTAVAAEVSAERTEPTCDTDGSVVYTAKVTFDGKEYTDTKTEVLAATGHAYDTVTGWSWVGYTSATVQVICSHDASHVTQLTAEVTADSQSTANCEEGGITVHTAKVVVNGREYVSTMTETVAATGHSYALTSWKWNGYTEAEVLLICANDETHTKTVTATVVSEEITPATYVAPGAAVHTARVTVDGREYVDVRTELIPQKVHNYGEPTWEWSEDNSTANAKFVNVDDPDDTATLSADVTVVRVEPTAEKDGSVTYTAKVTVMGKEYTDVRVVVLPKTDGKTYDLVFGKIEAFENAKMTPASIGVIESEGVYSVKFTVELPEGVSIESVEGVGGSATLGKSNARAGGASVEITWTSDDGDVTGIKELVKFMLTLPRGTKIGDKLDLGLTVTEATNKAGQAVALVGKAGSVDYTHVIFDVNDDKSTNARDINAVMKYMVGSITENDLILSRADINYDGSVNAKDISTVMKYLVGTDIAFIYGKE